MQQKASRVHNIDRREMILITFQVFAERTINVSHIYIFEMINLFLLKENKFRWIGKLRDVKNIENYHETKIK